MRHLIAVVLMAAAPLTAGAQQPAAAPEPAQAPAPAPRPGSAPAAQGRQEAVPTTPVNIRYDVVIRDEGGGGPATRRTVSLVVQANSGPGSVRSVGTLPASHPLAAGQVNGPPTPLAIPLNIDVRGSVSQSGRIPSRVTVEYQPFWPEAKTLPSSVRAQVDAVLEDGRALLLSQAVDPISDRRTIIEVTATILK